MDPGATGQNRLFTLSSGTMAPGGPYRQLALWPDARPLAAVLTHDVDQIYDRDFFRVLADLNHLKRVWFGSEFGQAKACLSRIARSILHPKRTGDDIRRLRAIERRYGWRSTFFLLEDRYWARYGGRYRWDDPDIRQIAAELLEEGCELGIHGSYYRFGDSAFLRRQKERFESVFGVPARGIRNHYLRFEGVNTWLAQEKAGFVYDSTYGRNEIAGTRGGLSLPFFPCETTAERYIDVLELPLTLMDDTVYRTLGLNSAQVAEIISGFVEKLAMSGGLGIFLWHNNYFDEAEYSEWEGVYGFLLSVLQEAKAWVVTADELQQWWRNRAAVSIIKDVTEEEEEWYGTIRARRSIDGLCLGFSVVSDEVAVEASEPHMTFERNGSQVLVRLPHLGAGEAFRLRVTGCLGA